MLKQKSERTSQKPEGNQCPASFKTPDGQSWYCQHRGRVGHAGRHVFNVARHPVTWLGSAVDASKFCGDASCPGGRPVATVSDFDPAANDATAEVLHE